MKAVLVMLRERREAAGVTQAQLAEKLRKPQSYVAKVEGSERRLDVIEFCNWATALGSSPSRLIADMEAEHAFEPDGRPN